MPTLIFLYHGQPYTSDDQAATNAVLTPVGQEQASSGGALLGTQLPYINLHDVLIGPARCTGETFVFGREGGLKHMHHDARIRQDARLLPFSPLKSKADATWLETVAAERRYWEQDNPNHHLDDNPLNESFTKFVERVDDVVREAFARTTDTLCVTSWDVIALALFRQIHPTAHVPPSFMRSYLDYRDMTRLPYGGSIGIKPRRKT